MAKLTKTQLTNQKRDEVLAALSEFLVNEGEDVLRVSRQILPDTVYFLYGDMTEEGEEGDDFGDEA